MVTIARRERRRGNSTPSVFGWLGAPMSSAPEEVVRASLRGTQLVTTAQSPASITVGSARARADARASGFPSPRQMLNFGLALISLVLLAPFMLLIALLVKLTSRGPVLFTQP